MEERLIFSELSMIEAVTCILGLKFPDSANEFQKAFLTLAHLMASCRDYVLNGHEVPNQILVLIDELNTIIYHERDKQR